MSDGSNETGSGSGSRERFRDFCRENFGGDPDVVHVWEPTRPGVPPFEVAVWWDQPFEGCMTAVTWGLSEAGHEEWYTEVPELMIRLETQDVAWALAMALAVEEGWGTLPFEYGTVFGFDEPLAKDSRMTAMFLYGPPVVEGESDECDRGDDEVPIALVGCYPIYESEVPLVESDVHAFCEREDFDLFSVERPELR